MSATSCRRSTASAWSASTTTSATATRRASRSGVIPPATVPTSILVDAAPTSGVSGTNLTIGATLTGAPAGSEVTFSLGSVSATGTTNAVGRATATLPLQDAVATYSLSATYAGDTTYQGFDQHAVLQHHQGPDHVDRHRRHGQGPQRVPDPNRRQHRRCRNRPCTFTVTGPVSKQLTATTDLQGRAQTATRALPDGTYTVVASFLGTPTTFRASVVGRARWSRSTPPGPTVSADDAHAAVDHPRQHDEADGIRQRRIAVSRVSSTSSALIPASARRPRHRSSPVRSR